MEQKNEAKLYKQEILTTLFFLLFPIHKLRNVFSSSHLISLASSSAFNFILIPLVAKQAAIDGFFDTICFLSFLLSRHSSLVACWYFTRSIKGFKNNKTRDLNIQRTREKWFVCVFPSMNCQSGSECTSRLTPATASRSSSEKFFSHQWTSPSLSLSIEPITA